MTPRPRTTALLLLAALLSLAAPALAARQTLALFPPEIVPAGTDNALRPAVMLLEAPLTAAGSKVAWLALAMSSTFAGNLTLVGSIANLIVAQLAREESPISYVEYLKVGVPLTIGSTAIGIAVLAVQGLP